MQQEQQDDPQVGTATATITRSVRLATAPSAVWDLVGDFAGIHRWHPETTEPVLRDPAAPGGEPDPTAPGVERVFGGGTDAEFVERLVARDAVARRIAYTIPDPPFPITDHLAVVSISGPDAGPSDVVWSASFTSTPETAKQLEAGLGDGVFQVGLDALADGFGTA